MNEQQSSDAAFWKGRLEAVGRAQGRYVFLLALAGLFYYALDIRVTDVAGAPSSVQLPALSVDIAPVTVWATGPITLGILLLAVLGSFHAIEHAATQYKNAAGLSAAPGLPERMDVAFNILDAIVYTTPSTPGWATKVLRMTYPLILTIFWIEAATFLAVEFAFDPADLFPHQRYPLWQTIAAWIFRVLGLVAVALPAPRLWTLWTAKLATARN